MKVTVYVVVTVYSGVLHEVEGRGTEDAAESYAAECRKDLGISDDPEAESEHTVSVWPLTVDIPDSGRKP
ncbi:hypothetical protein LCGC14_3117310 [marine sediment metagenome]|uniref:Uncharacterized protein n=1 Tax=marine sediment metagenome TaxID=412755 RepID=A0A0F8W392_9ZZZZ